MPALVEGERRPAAPRRRRGRSRRGSPCASRRRGGSPSPGHGGGESGQPQPVRARPRGRPISLGRLGDGIGLLLKTLRNLPGGDDGRHARVPARMSASRRNAPVAMTRSAADERAATDRPGRGSPVYPLGSRVNERGHLEVGGCDVVEVAREFGTPAYIYAEDDIRARARAYLDAFGARTDDFEVLFASKAAPFTAIYRLLRGGGALGRRRLGRRAAHGAAAPGSTRRGSTCTATTRPSAELREALEAGVGHVICRLVRRDRAPRRAAATGRRTS